MFETLIVNPIFNALMLLYSIIPGGDFGVAIIIFTIIIRFIMYPLVKRQLHQTKLMRKLQPELAKIKKAAKGNRQVEAMQQMELYKRFGVKPFRSILILLLQLPIFIGLYQVIQIMTSHREQMVNHIYTPLQNIPAIKTIIEDPNNFNHHLLGFIDITKTAVSNTGLDFVLVTLAVISAVTQYVMSKQTLPTTQAPKKKFREIMAEAAAGKQSDPADMSNMMMNNMIKIMPVLMFFIMLSLPGALALYYTVSNLVATAQQSYLLRKDVEEMDELADEVIAKEDAKTAKSTSTKSRGSKAKEAQITRIKAKE